MISILIVIALIVFLILYTEEWLPGICCGLFLGLGIVLMITIIKSEIAGKEYVPEPPKQIIALQDNMTISGRFFLGTGTVGGEMAYYYFAKDEIGAKMGHVPMTETHVIESTDAEPSVQKFKARYKSAFLRFNFVLLGDYAKYRITVPPGSIIREYTVDLK